MQWLKMYHPCPLDNKVYLCIYVCMYLCVCVVCVLRCTCGNQRTALVSVPIFYLVWDMVSYCSYTVQSRLDGLRMSFWRFSGLCLLSPRNTGIREIQVTAWLSVGSIAHQKWPYNGYKVFVQASCDNSQVLVGGVGGEPRYGPGYSEHEKPGPGIPSPLPSSHRGLCKSKQFETLQKQTVWNKPF